MGKAADLLLVLALTAVFDAAAQGFPPAPPPPPPPADFTQGQRPYRDWHELSPDQREQLREQHRQRREAWRNLSPEERQQFRRDIRDAGQAIYPPGRHRGRD